MFHERGICESSLFRAYRLVLSGASYRKIERSCFTLNWSDETGSVMIVCFLYMKNLFREKSHIYIRKGKLKGVKKMSCHQIGHAANHMVNCIFKKYDNGEFGKDTAKDLIRTAVDLIGYCDGNEYEAYETAGSCRCGNCFKKMKIGENLYQPSYSLKNSIDLEEYMENCAYDVFCEDCVKKIFPESVVENILTEECLYETVYDTWD